MERVDPPYEFIAQGLKAGEVIPFFGAAASAIYRPAGEAWQPGRPFTPFGSELARTLAAAASYPKADGVLNTALSEILSVVEGMATGTPLANVEAAIAPVLRKHFSATPSLALVASWAEHVQGHRRAVERKLHEYFSTDCKPGLLHTALAKVEGVQLFITTNYDHLIENAMSARQPHVIVDRGLDGLWVSVAGGQPERMAATGDQLYGRLNETGTSRPSRPVVFKMHGSVDPVNPKNDAYLITEEDYVDFLGRPSGSYLPPYVSGLMEGKDLLFLGYSLEDWNVRVIVRKLLLRPSPSPVRCWAIVRGRSNVEQRIWQSQNLNIHEMDLVEFSESLAAHL